MDLHEMLRPTVVPVALAGALDQLDDSDRLRAAVGLRRSELAAVFEAAADNQPLRLTDLVPAETPAWQAVIHEGKNSLPMFTRFQKLVCRPPGEDRGELWGYNEQDLRAITGPGYFVLHHSPRNEVIVDYTQLPPQPPPGWPKILPNSARLSRFIYNGTIDVLRRVSEGVTIGRAYRQARPMDNWFVLVRRASPRPADVAAG
jgi:hypothetical protein